MSPDKEKSIENIVNDLINELNVLGGDVEVDEVAEVMAKTIMNNHRTLQQSFFRMVQNVTEIYADETKTDLRNHLVVMLKFLKLLKLWLKLI